MAAGLGFSETVFVDDPSRGEVRIFTPAAEVPLAGHPLVGTAWLLAEKGAPVETLRPPAGEVPTWADGELTWIRGRPRWPPLFELRQLGSAGEVDQHPGAERPDDLLAVWAWESEPEGRIRARVFPRGLGIDEDEATGKAALQLAAEVGRPATIRQGGGSLIHARPGPEGAAEIGGRVALVEPREHPEP